MPKAEISWKRVTEDGEKLQVYVQREQLDFSVIDTTAIGQGVATQLWQAIAALPRR